MTNIETIEYRPAFFCVRSPAGQWSRHFTFQEGMAMRRTTYEELEIVDIPEDVPELGVEAGTMGTIVTVYEGGRMLLVEIGREDGTSVGLVDLEVKEDGSLGLISYTPFTSR